MYNVSGSSENRKKTLTASWNNLTWKLKYRWQTKIIFTMQYNA